MSKVYESENQLILRVPIEIARKINESIERGKDPDFIELIPLTEKDDTEPMKFK